MKRFGVLMVGAFMVWATPATTRSAWASPRLRTDWGAIQGTYNEFYDWGRSGTYTEQTLTLTVAHTGSDDAGDTIHWVASGRRITLRVRSPQGLLSIWRGRITERGGFSSPRRPGSMSDNSDTGSWYAIKTS